MLLVILLWTYVTITTYLMGYCFIHVILSRGEKKLAGTNKGKTKKEQRYRIKSHKNYIITGVVLTTVYAQIFSLFSGIDLAENILLVAICVVIATYYRVELREDLADLTRRLKSEGNIFLYAAVFLIMAYATSHGIMHYDSDLYHAQSIRWIEEFGVVKGLGNLHVRLAYNSSAFALSALYSMAFLGGQSYHVMAGFLALILGWQCLDIKHIIVRKHFILSDFARIAAIYYLFTVLDEIVSPASDYFLASLVFYIIISWLDLNVVHEKSYVPYIHLALLGVFAVTIKLAAAPLLLLSLVPIYKLMRNRDRHKMKVLGVSVLFALLIVAPFLIRNVLISGWLVYPVTFIDLFNVSWKIPKGLAQYDALEIKTFGRGFSDVVKYGNAPLSVWFPTWFKGLLTFDKGIILLDIVSIVIYLLMAGLFLGTHFEKKATKENKVFSISHRTMLNQIDFMAIGGTMIICLLFWFNSAPLIRYGIDMHFLPQRSYAEEWL
ncbi:hypothetical protein D6853_02380 [Butyrivibrio sp. X503]|uniref:LIC_10190 family membrane protein n=1 Tax=Butyrivibrio sp. X503 TaxID=2364878 RepID=UPI000EAA00EA|nr:hypothetical protein [Butyrivibrio sp. X503]RKM58400.1 hypothetical protein D6853_02380 [Butyrivibrio sp. X503]